VSDYPQLFAPGEIGGLAVRNRIVQPPMGTGLVEHGQVTGRDVAFQEERARAGVGLIVTGAAVVHPTSRFPVGSWSRRTTTTWRVDPSPGRAVQRHGARIFGQTPTSAATPGGSTEAVPCVAGRRRATRASRMR
jgi:2,4-dienoyl-CoA reductase (NADPH2)